MLGVVAAFAFLMVQHVSADVCTDNMIYMDLCVQWKDMCQQSKFLQDKCPRTCGTCAPVNCTWADWGNFTQCTESCGGGFKTRSRVIASPPLYGGAACEGDAFESVACNVQPCTGDAREEAGCNTHNCAVNCEYEAWGNWTT